MPDARNLKSASGSTLYEPKRRLQSAATFERMERQRAQHSENKAIMDAYEAHQKEEHNVCLRRLRDEKARVQKLEEDAEAARVAAARRRVVQEGERTEQHLLDMENTMRRLGIGQDKAGKPGAGPTAPQRVHTAPSAKRYTPQQANDAYVAKVRDRKHEDNIARKEKEKRHFRILTEQRVVAEQTTRQKAREALLVHVHDVQTKERHVGVHAMRRSIEKNFAKSVQDEVIAAMKRFQVEATKVSDRIRVQSASVERRIATDITQRQVEVVRAEKAAQHAAARKDGEEFCAVLADHLVSLSMDVVTHNTRVSSNGDVFYRPHAVYGPDWRHMVEHTFERVQADVATRAAPEDDGMHADMSRTQAPSRLRSPEGDTPIIDEKLRFCAENIASAFSAARCQRDTKLVRHVDGWEASKTIPPMLPPLPLVRCDGNPAVPLEEALGFACQRSGMLFATTETLLQDFAPTTTGAPATAPHQTTATPQSNTKSRQATAINADTLKGLSPAMHFVETVKGELHQHLGRHTPSESVAIAPPPRPLLVRMLAAKILTVMNTPKLLVKTKALALFDVPTDAAFISEVCTIVDAVLSKGDGLEEEEEGASTRSNTPQSDPLSATPGSYAMTGALWVGLEPKAHLQTLVDAAPALVASGPLKGRLVTAGMQLPPGTKVCRDVNIEQFLGVVERVSAERTTIHSEYSTANRPVVEINCQDTDQVTRAVAAALDELAAKLATRENHTVDATVAASAQNALADIANRREDVEANETVPLMHRLLLQKRLAYQSIARAVEDTIVFYNRTHVAVAGDNEMLTDRKVHLWDLCDRRKLEDSAQAQTLFNRLQEELTTTHIPTLATLYCELAVSETKGFLQHSHAVLSHAHPSMPLGAVNDDFAPDLPSVLRTPTQDDSTVPPGFVKEVLTTFCQSLVRAATAEATRCRLAIDDDQAARLASCIEQHLLRTVTALALYDVAGLDETLALFAASSEKWSRQIQSVAVAVVSSGNSFSQQEKERLRVPTDIGSFLYHSTSPLDPLWLTEFHVRNATKVFQLVANVVHVDKAAPGSRGGSSPGTPTNPLATGYKSFRVAAAPPKLFSEAEFNVGVALMASTTESFDGLRFPVWLDKLTVAQIRRGTASFASSVRSRFAAHTAEPAIDYKQWLWCLLALPATVPDATNPLVLPPSSIAIVRFLLSKCAEGLRTQLTRADFDALPWWFEPSAEYSRPQAISADAAATVKAIAWNLFADVPPPPIVSASTSQRSATAEDAVGAAAAAPSVPLAAFAYVLCCDDDAAKGLEKAFYLHASWSEGVLSSEELLELIPSISDQDLDVLIACRALNSGPTRPPTAQAAPDPSVEAVATDAPVVADAAAASTDPEPEADPLTNIPYAAMPTPRSDGSSPVNPPHLWDFASVFSTALGRLRLHDATYYRRVAPRLEPRETPCTSAAPKRVSLIVD